MNWFSQFNNDLDTVQPTTSSIYHAFQVWTLTRLLTQDQSPPGRAALPGSLGPATGLSVQQDQDHALDCCIDFAPNSV